MSDNIDLEALARELAEIARATTDEEMGRRLMEVVHRILGDAGLADLDDIGGGDLPPGEVHAMVNSAC